MILFCLYKQYHLIRGCQFSLAYHENCSLHLGAVTDFGYVMITYALGDSGVHIPTLLVAKIFTWEISVVYCY